MFGLVKKLFGGILAFIGSIFSFGKKDKKIAPAKESLESKVVEAKPPAPENKKQPKAKKQAKPEAAFFLEAEDARGYTSANGKSAANPQKAKKEAAVASTTASALNLPAPTVSSAPAEAASPFVKFARRRPGANMSAFLDMAKQVKTSN
ncbi:MAG: hypothetical protein KME35_13620 [Aphanocapsa sp. GSE-SYN-MK-11-07L]|jgi:hypothetical protein|nr:hypothetical protein [Aphanocapsa sp. GSE-SYN-MK-11-07L]